MSISDSGDVANNSLNLPQRLEDFKSWSSKFIKIKKQSFEEKIGTVQPSRDLDLEAKISQLLDLKEMQAEYRTMLDCLQTLRNALISFVEAEISFSRTLAHLSTKQLDLNQEFELNSNMHKTVSGNGQALVIALDSIYDRLTTLVSHTMEDTIITVRNLHDARLEFDADKRDLETATERCKIAESHQVAQAMQESNRLRVQKAQEKFNTQQALYERLKKDVEVKAQLVNENRLRVVRQQMNLLHEACLAFFTGNGSTLHDVMQRYSLVSKKPMASSILEKTEDDATAPIQENGHQPAAQ